MHILLANIFGVEQWLVVLVLVLLLFGGTKIPELMRGVGKGVGELQKGLEEGKRTLRDSMNEDTRKREEEEAAKKRDEEAKTVSSQSK